VFSVSEVVSKLNPALPEAGVFKVDGDEALEAEVLILPKPKLAPLDSGELHVNAMFEEAGAPPKLNVELQPEGANLNCLLGEEVMAGVLRIRRIVYRITFNKAS
jgi:hypothetical protein